MAVFWVSHVKAAYVSALERRRKPPGVDIAGWRMPVCLLREARYIFRQSFAGLSGEETQTLNRLFETVLADLKKI